MSAAEIIAMIKKLPPEEKAEVMAFLRNEPEGVTESGSDYTTTDRAADRKFRTIPEVEAERIAEDVFERHSELFRKLAQ